LGAIRHQVRVIDVSTDNHWTAVRVALSERDRFGAEYATNGFIYGWPIELGPQIIHVAQALQTIDQDMSHRTSTTLPVVIGPTGAPADNQVLARLPSIVYGGRKRR
jgi:hypothetical protein